MRRLYILFFCLLLVGSIVKPSFSEERKGSTIDGYIWTTRSEVMKSSFIFGFLWGNRQAALAAALSAEDYAFKEFAIAEEIDPKTSELIDEMLGLLDKRLNLSGITIDQILDGLDNFYRDSRNMKIFVEEAIWIVKLEIKGAPQEYIDEEVRLLRMPKGKKRFKEWLRLLEKNQAYREAWEKWNDQIPRGVLLLGTP